MAALAVASAALSLAIGRGNRPAGDVNDPSSAAITEDAGLLETAAKIVRSAAHAHDLAEALHGAARILFQELGAEGLLTGRLDDAGTPLRADRFDEPSLRTAISAEGMSPTAAEAVRSQRVVAGPRGGFALPVLREGRTVAWLEFTGLQRSIAAPALQRLLDLVRLELSAVSERSVWHAGAKFVATDDAAAWREREAANAPTLVGAEARRPALNESRALLVRYPQRRCVGSGEPASRPADALDADTLDRLRKLDPSGVDRLLERVVKAFEASAMRLIPQLREGARIGDLDGVKQVAHTLRSASASIGAIKLSRLCADIETQGRAEDGADLATRVKSMVGEIDIVLSVLRSLPTPRT